MNFLCTLSKKIAWTFLLFVALSMQLQAVSLRKVLEWIGQNNVKVSFVVSEAGILAYANSLDGDDDDELLIRDEAPDKLVEELGYPVGAKRKVRPQGEGPKNDVKPVRQTKREELNEGIFNDNYMLQLAIAESLRSSEVKPMSFSRHNNGFGFFNDTFCPLNQINLNGAKKHIPGLQDILLEPSKKVQKTKGSSLPFLTKVPLVAGRGFANMGNTCYINSWLQCLFNIPSLMGFLRNNQNLYQSGSLVQHLVNLYGNQKDRGLLKKFGDGVRKVLFEGSCAQQCVHALHSLFFGRLTGAAQNTFVCDEYNLSSVLGCYTRGFPNKYIDGKKTKLKGPGKQVCGFVEQLLSRIGVWMRYSSQCSCGQEYARVPVETCVVVSPTSGKKDISFHEVFYNSFPKKYCFNKGDDLSLCDEGCKKNIRRKRKYEVIREDLPGVLVFYLGCFDAGGNKIQTSITKFPVPMLEFEGATYRFKGAVYHAGPSRTSGHYMALLRKRLRDTSKCTTRYPKGTPFSEYWVCNDNQVYKHKGAQQAEADLCKNQGWKNCVPYMLFYEKK